MIGERAVADDDARGMHAGVSREPFELLGLAEELRNALVVFEHLLELWLELDGLLDGGGLALSEVGNQARDALGFRRRNAHGARHVLDHAARLEILIGRDLPDAVLAVFLRHVGDDLVAPGHAKIDVEVGHADALGIQEALEQEVIRDRIDFRDAEGIGHEGAGSRSTSRSHRDPPMFRLANEVPDDQEVARVLHAGDHIELLLEACAVRGFIHAPVKLLESLGQALARDVAEVPLHVEALRHRKLRQHRLVEGELESRAHLRDDKRVLEQLGMTPEGLSHLVRALQIHLEAAVMRGPLLSDHTALANAVQVQVCFAIIAPEEVHVVGRDPGQAECLSGRCERFVHDPLLGKAVVLKLDEQVTGLERVPERAEHSLSVLGSLLHHALRRDASETPGETYETGTLVGDALEGDARSAVGRCRRVTLGDEPNQVSVTFA